MLAPKYWPRGWAPHPWQAELVDQIIAGWSSHELIVVTAPTATGKSWIMGALANWRAACGERVTVCPNTNILVNQMADYGGTVLHGKEHYPDIEAARAAQASAKDAMIRLMNPYTMVSYRMASPVVMVDEAHTLVSMLDNRLDVRLSQATYGFPDDLARLEDVIAWAQQWLRDNTTAGEAATKLRRGLGEMLLVEGGATVTYHTRTSRKPDKLLHVMAHGAKSALWWLFPPGKVRKILLFSATINEQDVAELGLGHLKALYLTCPSPIPPARRPVVYEPVVHMGAKYRKTAMKKFAARIRQLLASRSDNGVIHLTYDAAKLLRTHLGDEPRLLWHNNKNKAKVLGEFRRAAGTGAVLVASGMHEGVDLIGDIARWQVLGAMPHPSLADARTRERLRDDPGWYAWQTIKALVQAYGRVCRGPEDTGETFIFDVQFERLLREHRDLFPEFFLQALK